MGTISFAGFAFCSSSLPPPYAKLPMQSADSWRSAKNLSLTIKQLHYSLVTVLHFRLILQVKVIFQQLRLFNAGKSEAHVMPLSRIFYVLMGAQTGFTQDVEESLFCCFALLDLLRGDDRCWHFGFRVLRT